MAATPAAGLGSIIKYYDASDANPATVSGVYEIDPPSLETETTDVTELADTHRKRIATIKSLGPCTIKFRWDSGEVTQADVSGLRYLWTQKARRKFAIVANDTGDDDMSFYGYVTKFDVDPISVDGTYNATVEITVDGGPTFA